MPYPTMTAKAHAYVTKHLSGLPFLPSHKIPAAYEDQLKEAGIVSSLIWMLKRRGDRVLNIW